MRIAIEHIPLLISAQVFLTILCLCLVIFMYVRRRAIKREWVAKIKRNGTDWEKPEEKIPSDKTVHSILKQISDFLGNLGQRLAPKKSEGIYQLKIKFLKAGLRRPSVPHIFWGTKGLFAICLPLIFLVGCLLIFETSNFASIAAGCGLLGVIGFYLPNLWLHVRIASRKRKILEALPDTLDLLVICVEAGLGLDAAIYRVSEEISLSSKELSQELKLLNLEMRAGMERSDALRNLARRTDLEALNSLVTLLIQTEKFGTSIAKALRVYSDVFRTERFQKAEEIASKLPVKLLFPMIFFIFPSLFVVIMGPAAIRVYQILAK